MGACSSGTAGTELPIGCVSLASFQTSDSGALSLDYFPMTSPDSVSLDSMPTSRTKGVAPQGRGLSLRDFRHRFTRQRIVGSYILDFYCGAAKLTVELDGSQHCESEAIEYDKTRTRSMRF